MFDYIINALYDDLKTILIRVAVISLLLGVVVGGSFAALIVYLCK